MYERKRRAETKKPRCQGGTDQDKSNGPLQAREELLDVTEKDASFP